MEHMSYYIRLLLSSRLYCRFRIHTGSAALAGHGLSALRSEDQNHRRSGIYIAVSPCPEEFLILFTRLLYAFTLELSIPVSEKIYPFSFIVSWIRCFFRSTLMTFTSTISPTLTTSNGCLMNLSLIWEMCTSPS